MTLCLQFLNRPLFFIRRVSSNKEILSFSLLEVIDHYHYYYYYYDYYYYHYYLIIDSLLLIIITTRCKFKLYIKFRKKIFLAMKSQSLISCFMFRFNPCKYIQCMSLIVIMLFVNFNKSSSLYFPSNQCFLHRG